MKITITCGQNTAEYKNVPEKIGSAIQSILDSLLTECVSDITVNRGTLSQCDTCINRRVDEAGNALSCKAQISGKLKYPEWVRYSIEHKSKCPCFEEKEGANE